MEKFLYECDRKQCDNCYSECFHTTDINHAKNFTRHKGGPNKETFYVENDEKWGSKMTKNDLVCHPSHYTHDGIETIDKMQAIFGLENLTVICKANCFKYLDRYKYKGNALQDLSKAYWYATKALILLTDDENYSFEIEKDSGVMFTFNYSNSEYYVYKAKLQLSYRRITSIEEANMVNLARANIGRAYAAYKREHSDENN